MNCQHCGKSNPTDFKFCQDCGQPLVMLNSCPACGFQNQADNKFCMQCGRAFQTAAAEPIRPQGNSQVSRPQQPVPAPAPPPIYQQPPSSQLYPSQPQQPVPAPSSPPIYQQPPYSQHYPSQPQQPSVVYVQQEQPKQPGLNVLGIFWRFASSLVVGYLMGQLGKYLIP